MSSNIQEIVKKDLQETNKYEATVYYAYLLGQKDRGQDIIRTPSQVQSYVDLTNPDPEEEMLASEKFNAN